MGSKITIVIGTLSLLMSACQVGQEQGSHFELTGESTLTEEQKKEVVARSEMWKSLSPILKNA